MRRRLLSALAPLLLCAAALATTTTAATATTTTAPPDRRPPRRPGPQHRVRARDTPAAPPPYVPVATPPPDQDAALARQGFRQETFYACSTRAGGAAAHCGWHVPVVRAAAAPRADVAAVAVAVAGLAAGFALAMT